MLLTLKSPGFAPVTLNPDTVMVVEPVLVKVTVCVVTPNPGCAAGKLLEMGDATSVGLVVYKTTDRLGGGAVSVGWKGGVAGTRLKMFSMSFVGLLKMFNRAVTTSVGAEPPAGVL